MLFSSVEKPPRLSEFEMEIPEKRIAQHPSKNREACKMMVLNPKDKSIQHKKFKDIGEFMEKGDVLVMNNTMVYPARIYAWKEKSESKVEVFLLRELENDLWEAMVRPARKVRIGNKLIFGDGIECDVIDNTISGGRVLRFEYDVPTIYPFIDEHGLSPLPPYIKRKPTDKDKEMYQTVYATERGSVAAPTAGLHFSKELLKDIKSRGIKTAFITLHIGLGTFRPIMVEDLTRHQMDSEYYHVPEKTANIINLAKSKKQKVIAVGTSTVRTLETITVAGFEINKTEGWTDNFIYPPYKFKMVNKLITNFHQPKSTLMMMVAAMTKKDFLLEAYQEAIDKKYRFYSYGDAMMVI